MNSFFSNTDVQTLREEGRDRNHFVSLIVNNEGTYTAAITRKVKTSRSITEDISYSTFNDKEVLISSDSCYKEEFEEIEYFNLRILKESPDQIYLNDRLEDLSLKRKIKLEEERNKVSNKTYTNGVLVSTKGKNSSYTFKPYTFPDKKYDSYDNNLFDQIPLDEEYPYSPTELTINNEEVKSLTLQLLTGSILLPNSNEINLEKWAKGMVPLYEKRFGKDEYGMELFKEWAQRFIEFICFYNDETQSDDCIDKDYAEERYAIAISEELKKLPSNKYIEEFINILKFYYA